MYLVWEDLGRNSLKSTFLLLQSRKFLREQQVMSALVSDPGSVLDDVKLVIQTLQGLKKAYFENKVLLEPWTHSQVLALLMFVRPGSVLSWFHLVSGSPISVSVFLHLFL